MISELRITIITVCFNAENTIERAIRSVVSQTYPGIEYIIIDGGSNDKTLEIIQKYSTKINKIVSEKDNGIYDAMNKGLALATGSIVYFLNADDSLCDNKVLSDIARVFNDNDSHSFIYGKIRYEHVPDDYKIFLKETPVVKSSNDFLFHTICHQSIFAKKLLFDQIGYFDCRYKYAADYDWQIRSYKFNSQGFYFLNRDICNYNYIGRNYQHLQITDNENFMIRFNHLFSFYFIWYCFRFVLLRGLKKRLLSNKY